MKASGNAGSDKSSVASGYGGNRNYVYIVRCADGTLYTGWTSDLKKRIAAHNRGLGAKYTRGRAPVRLVYCEKFALREEAMSREVEIKKLSRGKKLELVDHGK